VDPNDRKRLLLEVGKRIFIGVAGDRPILLWLDDAQWLDPSSKAVLNAILSREQLRVLLVMTVRLSSEIPFKPVDSRISLTNLDAEQGAQLARQAAGSVAIPDPVIERIVERAEGNPLYINHLTGAIAKRAAAEPATFEQFDNLIAQSTNPLAAALFARLASMGAAREVAQIASVAAVGRIFDRHLLTAVALQSDVEIDATLEQLEKTEVIRSYGQEEDRQYEFSHINVQRALYEALIEDDRRDFHTRIAHYLLSLGDQARFHADLLSHHLRESGDIEASLPYRLLAGQAAVEAAAYKEAIQHFDVGLADLAKLPNTAGTMGMELKFQRSLIGPIAAAKGFSAPRFRDCGVRGLELSERLGIKNLMGPFLYSQFTSAISRGDVPLCRKHAEKFKALAEAANDETGLVIAHRSLGMVFMSEGRPQEAARELEESLRLYKESRDQSLVHLFAQDSRITGMSVLALVNLVLGHPTEARRIGLEAVERARALKHPLSLAIALSYYGGMVLGYSREPESVIRLGEELGVVSRDYGLRAFEYYAIGWCGMAHLQRSEIGVAIDALEQTVKGLTEIEWLLSIGNFETWLAEAYVAADRLQEAIELCDRMITRAQAKGERWYLSEGYRIRAKALQGQGAHGISEAIQSLQIGARIARNMPSPPFELRCLEDLAPLHSLERLAIQARIAELKSIIQ
jgi:tetratricopeptide (TPR) repeat protein